MLRSFRVLLIALFVLSLTASGCADSASRDGSQSNNKQKAPKKNEELNKDYQNKLRGLANEVEGRGKADFLNMGLWSGPCDAVGKMLRKSNGEYRDLNLGFQVGYAAQGSAAIVDGRAGIEVIADFLNYEMSVAKFWTAGARHAHIKSVDAGVSTYMGMAVGMTGVEDLYQQHYNIGSDISVQLFVFNVTARPEFWTTWDYNAEGWLEDAGPFGFRFYVEANAGIAGNFSGIGHSLTPSMQRGVRYPAPDATGAMMDALEGIDKYTISLDPKLVTLEDEKPCPEDFHDEDNDTNCKIQLTNEDDSHLERGAKLGAAICAMSSGCVNPFSLTAMAAATATGAIRSTGTGIHEYCGFDKSK